MLAKRMPPVGGLCRALQYVMSTMLSLPHTNNAICAGIAPDGSGWHAASRQPVPATLQGVQMAQGQ